MKKYFFFLVLSLTSLFGDEFIKIQRQLMEAEEELLEAEEMTLPVPSEKMTNMTGDWNGWRPWLACHGVRVIATYTTDMIGNPVGGHARGFAYAGSFGLGLNVNLEKAAGISGLDFFTSAVWRTGTNLSTRKIHNQFPVQQVYGSQTVKLNELFLKETLFNGRWILKAGRLDGGNDFLQSNLFYQYVNNAFDGNPVAVFNNFVFSAYPNATWGAYTFFEPVKRFDVKAAVYNANTYISKNRYHGVNFTFNSTNGVIWITEWAYRLNQEPCDTGMPGNYRVGFLYQTGPVSKFLNGIVRGDYCYYFMWDQMIYRPDGGNSKRSLTPFATFLCAPKDRNRFPLFFISGLVYQGPFEARPKDSINLGVAYGRYSGDLDKLEGEMGQEEQSFEMVVELNYWIWATDWLQITPDFQYIINPRGEDTPNAFCLGAQINIIL